MQTILNPTFIDIGAGRFLVSEDDNVLGFLAPHDGDTRNPNPSEGNDVFLAGFAVNGDLIVTVRVYEDGMADARNHCADVLSRSIRNGWTRVFAQ